MTRTILFDIDQTLLYSGGAGGLAMSRAFHELYGIENGFQRVESSGRTDWAILKAGLRQHGITNLQSFDHELASFQATYCELLPATLEEVDGGHLKPGVAALIDALAGRDDVRLGLATGNFRGAAVIKLRHFGLQTHLSEGGFGDDAEDRSELVGLAIERVAGTRARPRSVWVIGDTVLDVKAAHDNKASALGVATGTTSVEELRDAGAKVALEDLSDTEGVLKALLG